MVRLAKKMVTESGATGLTGLLRNRSADRRVRGKITAKMEQERLEHNISQEDAGY